LLGLLWNCTRNTQRSSCQRNLENESWLLECIKFWRQFVRQH
jgi:hypothetical protein